MYQQHYPHSGSASRHSPKKDYPTILSGSASAIWERGQHPTDPATTGGGGSTTVVYGGQGGGLRPMMTDSDVYRVGVYGWRKRCLYTFILLLSVVIVINLALTAWIMIVLDFSPSGLGSLEIIDNGIRVKGRAEFDQPVHFRNLVTKPGTALSIDSDRGLYMNARNKSGQVTSRLLMTDTGKVQVVCDRFEVRNSDRELVFFADRDEIGLKLENLRIIDEGGSVFEGAIQTAVIQPEPDRPLLLESPTRSLSVDAAEDIELLSRAGDIDATALHDIKLQSTEGEIHIKSPNLFLKGLRESHGGDRASQQFQVCICQNGKLFLARSNADCRADTNICS